MRIVKIFFAMLAVLLYVTYVGAVELRGAVFVNVTSDTAASAKNIAFDDATRQIVVKTLRQYADVAALESAVNDAAKADLSGLILSSGIEGEQTSDTTYSANVSMTIDVDVARSWLEERQIQHWLPNNTERNMFTVIVNLTNGLDDWAQLYRVANAEKLDIGTQNINGNTVVLQLPTSVRGAFTIAVRDMGWKYADRSGVLNIWK